MAATSNAVRRIGKNRCELCKQPGSEGNPLSRHHVDGDNKNNIPSNFMVVHRILCHTFADFITQFHAHHGTKVTHPIIVAAWHSFNWKEM